MCGADGACAVREAGPAVGNPEVPGGAAAMGLFGKTPEKPPKELVRGGNRRGGAGGRRGPGA